LSSQEPGKPLRDQKFPQRSCLNYIFYSNGSIQMAVWERLCTSATLFMTLARDPFFGEGEGSHPASLIHAHDLRIRIPRSRHDARVHQVPDIEVGPVPSRCALKCQCGENCREWAADVDGVGVVKPVNADPYHHVVHRGSISVHTPNIRNTPSLMSWWNTVAGGLWAPDIYNTVAMSR
jgi:hypothetical protein